MAGNYYASKRGPLAAAASLTTYVRVKIIWQVPARLGRRCGLPCVAGYATSLGSTSRPKTLIHSSWFRPTLWR
jgi:hypothetical protein